MMKNFKESPFQNYNGTPCTNTKNKLFRQTLPVREYKAFTTNAGSSYEMSPIIDTSSQKKL